MTTRSLGAPGARHASRVAGHEERSGYNVTNAEEYSKTREWGPVVPVASFLAEGARRIISPFLNERERSNNRDLIYAEKNFIQRTLSGKMRTRESAQREPKREARSHEIVKVDGFKVVELKIQKEREKERSLNISRDE